MSCSICFEAPVNPLECEFCDVTSCHKCAKDYIQSSSVPQCAANCHIWSVDFMLRNNLSDCTKYRLPMLMAQQEVLRAATMQSAAVQPQLEEAMRVSEVLRREEDALRSEKRALDDERKELRSRLSTLSKDEADRLLLITKTLLPAAIERNREKTSQKKASLAKGYVLEAKRDAARLPVAKRPAFVYTPAEAAGPAPDTELPPPKRVATIPTQVAPCPATDCRGVILSTSNNACPLCGTILCPMCNTISTGPDHACNQDDVLSIAAISETAKMCPTPGCGTMIEKASGCNNMWCTKCRKFFDYATLENIAPAHNPEFTDFMKTAAAAGNTVDVYIPRAVIAAQMEHIVQLATTAANARYPVAVEFARRRTLALILLAFSDLIPEVLNRQLNPQETADPLFTKRSRWLAGTLSQKAFEQALLAHDRAIDRYAASEQLDAKFRNNINRIIRAAVVGTIRIMETPMSILHAIEEYNTELKELCSIYSTSRQIIMFSHFPNQVPQNTPVVIIKYITRNVVFPGVTFSLTTKPDA